MMHLFLHGGLSMLVAAGLQAAQPGRFRVQTVDDQIRIGYGVAVADVDGDGRPDIVVADQHHILWYRNPHWTRQIMVERLTERDHVCVAALDLNGDGRAEIMVGAGWNPSDTTTPGALFELLAPEERTAPWRARPLPAEPTLHRIRWARDETGRWTLVTLPLHGRGNDPVSGTGAGVRVHRYTPAHQGPSHWKQNLLFEALHKTHNFDVVPWDDDPPDELVIASREGLFLWDPAPDGSARLTLLATNEVGGMGEVRLGRGPGGERFLAAIQPMHGHALAVYWPERGSGARTVLTTNLVEGHALVTGDFFGLGHDQIVVGWRGRGTAAVRVGVQLFVLRKAEASAWEGLMLDDAMACEDLAAADLDGDGDLDLVATGRATRNVKIYWNLRR